MKPLLACSTNITEAHQVEFPMYASKKLDGIRAILKDGVLWSRSGKAIPNKFIQSKVARILDDMCFSDRNTILDGELVLSGDDGLDFSKNSSAIMSENGEPDFEYYVFDVVNDDIFKNRWRSIKNRRNGKYTRVVQQVVVRDFEHCQGLFRDAIVQGFEGLILRKPDGIYKHGRSTLHQAYSLKMKPVETYEANIIGRNEQLKHDSVDEETAFGTKKKAISKSQRKTMGTLGSFDCMFEGKVFSIGSGLTDKQRDEYWAMDAKELTHKLVKFKCMAITKDGVPRHPVFLGLRDIRDM